MKYLLTAFVFTFLFSSSVSQSLTKTEFESSILSEFKSDLNITLLSNGFKKCAYDSYLKRGNAIENDFELGRQIGLQCFPEHSNGVIFTDNGEKMVALASTFFEEICYAQNKEYEQQIDVNGYCICVIDILKSEQISIEALLNPNLLPEALFKKAASNCIEENFY